MIRKLTLLIVILASAALHAQLAIGDTLTVIQRPILSVPAIVTPGETMMIECAAPSSASNWTADLVHDNLVIPLSLVSTHHDGNWERWFLEAAIPTPQLYELYDLRVSAAGVPQDTAVNAVSLIPRHRDSYFFAHITDTHLPTHYFLTNPESLTDSSEVDDLRAVIEQLNIIAPEFVIFTGDVVNEGELEDYQNRRYYTRAKRLIGEFEAPVYIVAGNHDIGGWDSTPEPDGTARRNWWRFFGWPRLDDPPPLDPYYTQNYTFTYGDIFFIGLEAYDNYDGWRYNIYGPQSFTSGQMDWLDEQLETSADYTSRVLFHHFDFSYQLNLDDLGVDLALWGHIHYDSGNIYSHPCDLATDSVCDGDRAFRLITVNNNTLTPHYTTHAGEDGEIEVAYTPDNSGQHSDVTAQVSNTYNRAFPSARVKFRMPAGEHDYTVTGGELEQVDRSGAFDICYVRLDLPPRETTAVRVRTGVGVDDEATPPVALGLHCRPNPFNPTTTFSFSASQGGHAVLAVYNVRGKRVRTLLNEPIPAGRCSIPWNGTDDSGATVASGVYFYRLEIGGATTSGKCLLLK